MVPEARAAAGLRRHGAWGEGLNQAQGSLAAVCHGTFGHSLAPVSIGASHQGTADDGLLDRHGLVRRDDEVAPVVTPGSPPTR